MVDEIPPAKLAKWLAVARLDGWGDGWYMVAHICATVHNSLMLVVAKFVGGEAIKEKDVKASYDCLPAFLKDEEDKNETLLKRFVQEEPGALEDWSKRMVGIK